MTDYRTGRHYVDLLVSAPRVYSGLMRLYVDRVLVVVNQGANACAIAWCSTPVVNIDRAIWLDVRMRGGDVRAMLERA